VLGCEVAGADPGAPSRDGAAQPEERQQPVCLGGQAVRVEPIAHAGGCGFRVRGRIDDQSRAHHLFDRERRRGRPVRQRSAVEDPHPLRRDAARELVGKTTLPHPGFADDRGGHRPAVAPYDPRERVEHAELFLAADQRRGADGSLTRKAELGQRFPNLDRHPLALGGDLADPSVLDRVARRFLRRHPDEDLPRICGVSDPARRVHGIAQHRVRVAAADESGDHLAGVQADVHAQRDAALTFQLRRILFKHALYDERRAHRALRVVLVRLRRAEHGHHLIADDLVDVPAVPLHDVGDALERAIDDRLHFLGVARLAQLGEPRQVAEQHRHDPALFPRGLCLRGAARRAELPRLTRGRTSRPVPRRRSGGAPRPPEARRDQAGSGRSTVKQVPWPGVLRTSTRPPRLSAYRFTR